jgi:hypothetical protein
MNHPQTIDYHISCPYKFPPFVNIRSFFKNPPSKNSATGLERAVLYNVTIRWKCEDTFRELLAGEVFSLVIFDMLSTFVKPFGSVGNILSNPYIIISRAGLRPFVKS